MAFQCTRQSLTLWHLCVVTLLLLHLHLLLMLLLLMLLVRAHERPELKELLGRHARHGGRHVVHGMVAGRVGQVAVAAGCDVAADATAARRVLAGELAVHGLEVGEAGERGERACARIGRLVAGRDGPAVRRLVVVLVSGTSAATATATVAVLATTRRLVRGGRHVLLAMSVLVTTIVRMATIGRCRRRRRRTRLVERRRRRRRGEQHGRARRIGAHRDVATIATAASAAHTRHGVVVIGACARHARVW